MSTIYARYIPLQSLEPINNASLELPKVLGPFKVQLGLDYKKFLAVLVSAMAEERAVLQIICPHIILGNIYNPTIQQRIPKMPEI